MEITLLLLLSVGKEAIHMIWNIGKLLSKALTSSYVRPET